MKDVILRNMERLLSPADEDREPIEPMSTWKWERLYQIATKYAITPWIADGLEAYKDDFFLQVPPDIAQKIKTSQEEKSEEMYEKFQLLLDRSVSPVRQFSSRSLQAYARDFLNTIKNIEE